MEWMILERRYRASAFKPGSIFYDELPQGEPKIMRRTVTTAKSDWEALNE
ncbi:hypothetical protein [Rathayibacter sp. VKM Ac-2630]|nr:hypothetical protein [Rathayibacter sp. VKM Ac-2630]